MDGTHREIGVGPTETLSLRVSAAALVRVTFEHPATGALMLALERKATLRREGERAWVSVVAQPFGGSSRILRPQALLDRIPAFHYDSERVKTEQDFRILIRPEDWQAVKQFCQQHFLNGPSGVLEADPVRELAEEFADALHLELSPADYHLESLGLLAENHSAPTDNLHAADLPTVRIYTLFTAHLHNPWMTGLILAHSAGLSDQDLQQLARHNTVSGGKGRANSVLAAPVDRLEAHYRALPPARRGEPVSYAGHTLSGNVSALLTGLDVSKYERFVTTQPAVKETRI